MRQQRVTSNTKNSLRRIWRLFRHRETSSRFQQVITEAGGRRVLSPKDLESALSVADQEQGVLLLLERDGQKTFAIFKP